MLRRHSTKSRSGLHRRKSYPSVHSVCLEHLDASTAQRDAQIAAHCAFDRAKNRPSTDSSLFPQPPTSPRRQETGPRVGYRDHVMSENGGIASGYQRIRRQQSVRFVSPKSTLSRTSSRVAPPSIRVTASPSRFDSPSTDRSKWPGTLSKPGRLRNFEPGSSNQEAPPLTYASTISEDYLHSLLVRDEHYTPEDDVASLPSSYRRLRRSKSMFTRPDGSRSLRSNARYTANTTRDEGKAPRSASPRDRVCQANKENTPLGPPLALRAPKSMSFLNRRRVHNEYLPHPEVGSNTAYHPRNVTQATNHTQRPPSSLRSATLRGSRVEWPGFEMRRSPRGSSSNSGIPTVFTEPTTRTLAEPDLKTRARKASHSLKAKLKKLFNLTKTDVEESIPEQHIKSDKSHASGPGIPVSISRGHGDPDSGYPIHHAPSTIPSIREVPSPGAIRSYKGSVEDLTCYQQRRTSDERSRVTSWTNSGPSTLTSLQQQTWSGWENRPLSAIRENDRQPRTPLHRRPRLGTHFPQSQESPLPPTGYTPDSQRVYSALMKRFQETNQVSPVGQQSQDPDEGHHSVNYTRMQEDRQHSNPLTVRCVTPDLNPNKLQGGATSQLVNLDEGSDELNGGSSPVPGREYPSIEGRECPASPVEPNPYLKSPVTSRREMLGMGVSFFGSPKSHLFRTASPYRRALKKSMEEAESTALQERHTAGSGSSETGTLIHHVIPSNPGDDEYSESVYSTASNEGEENVDKDSVVLGDEFPEPSSRLDDEAIISTDPPVAYRPTGQRAASSVSSVDWKTWLSANIAKAEPSQPPPRPAVVGFTTPSKPSTYFGRGHVRECAQINADDDEEEEERLGVPTRYPAPPTTPIATSGPNVVKIPSYHQSVKKDATPTVEGPTEKYDPNRAWQQTRLVDTGGPRTPPLQVNNNTPQTSPAYRLNSMQPMTEPGWKSVAYPQSENKANRHNNSTRRLARIRAACKGTSTGSPLPSSARLRRRVLPPKDDNVATILSLTGPTEKQSGDGDFRGGENKENEAGAGREGGERGFGGDGGAEVRVEGSKTMVEMFLSSRRRRLASSDESDAFV